MTRTKASGKSAMGMLTVGVLLWAPLGTVAAAPGASDVGAIVSTFLDTECQPGYDEPIAWTGEQGVPLNGAFWSQGWLQGAGPTYNASVWGYNYQVGDRCVAGVSAQVAQGPTYRCPPSGADAPPLASAPLLIPEGTYWSDGDLYLQATSQTATVSGYNNDVGNSCAPSATYDPGSPTQDDQCLTCVSACHGCPPLWGTGGRTSLLP